MGTKGLVREVSRDQAVELLTGFMDCLESIEQAYPGMTCYTLGSYRRRAETVNDIDIAVIYDDKASWPHIIQQLSGCHAVATVEEAGMEKARFILNTGLQVDILCATKESEGAMMMHFTGSKGFNIQCRARAKSKGLILNEKGLFDRTTKERVPGTDTEEGIMAALGMDFTPPHER